MKKLFCDMGTILAGLGFIMVLGAAIEGTLALAGAAFALAFLAAVIAGLYRLSTATFRPCAGQAAGSHRLAPGHRAAVARHKAQGGSSNLWAA